METIFEAFGRKAALVILEFSILKFLKIFWAILRSRGPTPFLRFTSSQLPTPWQIWPNRLTCRSRFRADRDEISRGT